MNSPVSSPASRPASRPLLEVAGLGVDAGDVPLVRDVSFTVARGERVGVIGESGSGKTLTALALLGLLDDGLRASGSVRLDGVPFDLVGAGDRELSGIRGRLAGMVFQEPMTALNPVMRVGPQIAETLRLHGTRPTRAAAGATAVELLGRLRLPDPDRAARSYPHQLSGGQRQRGVLGIALANDPALFICDEPTTALDVTVQKEIVDLVTGLSDERGTAVLYISHDLALVASVCHRVLVMYGGRIVESGPVERVLSRPSHPYTEALLAACDLTPGTRPRAIPGSVPPPGAAAADGCVFRDRCAYADDACAVRPEAVPDVRPGGGAVACWHPRTSAGLVITPDVETDVQHRPAPGPVLLTARGLTRRYAGPRGRPFARRAFLTALEDVDLELRAGRRLGVVGESGSGKTTLLRLLAGLDRPTAGTVSTGAAGAAACADGGSGIQVVFQDPMGSLDPRMRVRDIVAEPLRAGGGTAARVAEVLAAVGLPPDAGARYPHQFSGGQRQRVAIARALAPGPSVLLADEPVSALDVSVRAQILDVLREVTEERGMGLCVVSHDLGVIRYLCDEVVVLWQGKAVERGAVEDVWERPEHSYTERLLGAIPAALNR
ncbi:ABC transporter ATP-binding protein [Streptomyces sp. UNOC14_S4]|uniref:dipeptide ABC transporter ATP-binding protein n=1 Tax=Streptomyces sp. UNOC14_S4 TaxID=2872340 RepID=UPI001E513BAF|nr:ABC transporter ATP-binding protein [Streptomyces sp. UNOC14_S4]MCC3770812.1 ABC transporter ATP-binding protein [Streptomyces sp. UNOC14_S4]